MSHLEPCFQVSVFWGVFWGFLRAGLPGAYQNLHQILQFNLKASLVYHRKILFSLWVRFTGNIVRRWTAQKWGPSALGEVFSFVVDTRTMAHSCQNHIFHNSTSCSNIQGTDSSFGKKQKEDKKNGSVRFWRLCCCCSCTWWMCLSGRMALFTYDGNACP